MNEPPGIELSYILSFRYSHPSHSDSRAATGTGSASSAYVGNTPPPAVLIKRDAQFYIDKAHTFLTSSTATQDARLNTHHKVSETFSGNRTEADAVSLSNAHILQPVMVALAAKYPSWKLQRYSEVAAAPLRVDTAVKRQPHGENDAVMLIEYKRSGYIHPKQFEPAMCRADQVEKIRAYIWDKFSKYSVFEGGNTKAYRYMQQATAYWNNTGCPYVVLCDYDNMILLRYLNKGAYEPAEASIVPRDMFRMALLGFAIAACEHKQRVT